MIADKLVSVFEVIRSERMEGVPTLNPNLSVEAVDFRDWRGHCLGILITPWFMDLMVSTSAMPLRGAFGRGRG